MVDNPMHHESPPSPEKTTGIRIASGSGLPEWRLTNQEIATWDLKKNGKPKSLSAAAITKNIGVEFRYVANETETPLYLGKVAAHNAWIASGKKRPDAIIVSTSIPQGFNVSKRIAEELGFSNVFNLDVHAACSGFTRSLSFLKENEQEFNGQRLMLITTEGYSKYVHDHRTEDWDSDQSHAQFLFSDEAHAISPILGSELKILSTLNHRFPKEFSGLVQIPVDPKLMVPPFISEFVPSSESGKFEQNGHKVIELIRANIGWLVEDTVRKANLKSSEIDKIFSHQGSRPTAEVVIEALFGYSVFKDYKDGNPSSGAILRAFIKAANLGEIYRDRRYLFAGFGGGMFSSMACVQA